MTAIPFPSGTAPGDHGQESAGRLINAYAEPIDDTSATRRRVPGMATFASPSTQETPVADLTGYRGAMFDGQVLFAAYEDNLVYVEDDGAVTAVDTISGSDPVFFARNNKSPSPDLVAVCEDGVFTFTDSAVTSFADVDLPASNGVCFHQGYFIFTTGDGRAFASGLNAVTVNALDFVTAESNPDGLTRPVSFGNSLFLFGPSSTEIFGEPINDTGFPFSRITVIRKGLLQNTAVCGFESGFPGPLVFVGDDFKVHAVSGYEPIEISPPSLARRIKTAFNASKRLELSSYVSGGQAFVALSCSDWTWEYNFTTKKWHERVSYGATRWRGKYPVKAFGKWLAGDDQSDKIGEIDEAYQSELGEPLAFTVESAPVAKFPNRQRVARADFHMTAGVGIATGDDPTQTDPTVEISYSPDGVNWSDPMTRKMGRQGVPNQRVMVTNCGLSGPNGHRWRVVVSDAVPVSLLGGEMQTELKAG